MDPKEWREQANLTLLEIANAGGYKGISYISDVENGIKGASLRLARVYHKLSDGQVNLLNQ